jgi:phosphoribosylaminoimidazolecarboxamide formyltransferase/IMP cyclohydrolase
MGGTTSLELPQALAAKAFALTAAYDSMISQWFAFADQGERFPETWTFAEAAAMPLRYGENPHQQAALYCPVGPHAPGIAQASRSRARSSATTIQRRQCAALELVAEFRDGPPTVVIVKHANPCGVASATLVEAWNEALACDSVSAFGGIVAVNRPLDAADRRGDHRIFTEVVVAPDADEDARRSSRRRRICACC